MRQWNDAELLSAYANRQSQEAFGVLVERYVPLVHSAALRQVQNPHLAEEVTQAAFTILAQKARGLNQRTVLSGWLCRTAHFVARNALKTEFRRQYREKEALMQSLVNEPEDDVWQQFAPLLDEAVAQLNEADRNAVVLRFYEKKPLSEVGAILGIDADAAQKRVSRALEKLRKFFAKRGVDSTASAIAENIAAHSVQAAPAALAKTVTAVALAKGAAASTSTLTLIKGALKIMAWTKVKTAIVVGVGVLLAAGTGTVLIEKQINAWQYTPARAPWSDAGASTPKAALQSLAWALSQDKIDRAKELIQWDEKGTSANASLERQIALSDLAANLDAIESFRILSVKPTARPGEVLVKIEKTFKNKRIVPFVVTAKLRRARNQWLVVANIDYFQNNHVSTLLPFTGSF
jgi:RNA polymerase sigma factor (sigma-70 family)